MTLNRHTSLENGSLILGPAMGSDRILRCIGDQSNPTTSSRYPRVIIAGIFSRVAAIPPRTAGLGRVASSSAYIAACTFGMVNPPSESHADRPISLADECQLEASHGDRFVDCLDVRLTRQDPHPHACWVPRVLPRRAWRSSLGAFPRDPGALTRRWARSTQPLARGNPGLGSGAMTTRDPLLRG